MILAYINEDFDIQLRLARKHQSVFFQIISGVP